MKLDLKKPLRVRNLVTGKTHAVDIVHRLRNGGIMVIFDENSRWVVFNAGGDASRYTLRNVSEPEPERLTLDLGWVNVYRSSYGSVYHSSTFYQTKKKALAAKDASANHLACLHITREFAVGEGLE